MLKALFLTPQLPYPPHKGTTLRNFNLVKNLAATHEIHLLSFVEDGQEAAKAQPLRSLCHSIHHVPAPPRRSARSRLGSALLSPLPDMALRLPSPEFRTKLAALLARERFDVVQVEGIEMAQYMEIGPSAPNETVARGRVPPQGGGGPAPALRQSEVLIGIPDRSRSQPAIIFDEHNAEYLLQRRAFETDIRSANRLAGALYSLIQWRKLRAYERMACQLADAVVAVSEADRRALLALNPSLEVAVVPNGIDVEFLQAGSAGIRRNEEVAEPRLIFVGTMDYRPNVDAMVWFCRDIFPLVRREMPEVRLRIVGRNPARAVQKAAGQNVDLVGGVEDVRPYIYESSVYVIPMRIGGGVRFKALEAMACGVPVVSTRIGVEGIDVEDGKHLLIAEEPAEFAAKVVRLLKDREHARALSVTARARVTALYDWRAIVPRLEDLWHRRATRIQKMDGPE